MCIGILILFIRGLMWIDFKFIKHTSKGWREAIQGLFEEFT